MIKLMFKICDGILGSAAMLFQEVVRWLNCNDITLPKIILSFESFIDNPTTHTLLNITLRVFSKFENAVSPFSIELSEFGFQWEYETPV